MKMYILIRDDIDIGFSLVAASHASLACYLKYKDDDDMSKWLSTSFKKAICKINSREFDKAKTYEDYVVIRESSLENKEMAIAFKPREKWPKPFQFYKLYR